MSIIAGSCFQFLRDQLFNGVHDPENDVLFFAMYTTLANIDVKTANLQASLSDELIGSGYVAGGQALTQTVIYTPGGADRPVMDFDDLEFTGAVWGEDPGTAAAGAVIYNTTAGPQSNKILWVLDFGAANIATGGTVTVAFPDPTNPALAMIRSSG